MQRFAVLPNIGSNPAVLFFVNAINRGDRI